MRGRGRRGGGAEEEWAESLGREELREKAERDKSGWTGMRSQG